MDFKNIGSSDGRQQPPAAMPLARQSSVYSLTFDEFQNTVGGGIGKDFGSMNMDELLKNIWTAEETQAIASSGGGGGGAAAAAGASGLQRQGSLTLSRTISQKTVDEVWRDFVPAGDGFHPQQQRQPTLGEMTLEEFLVRAGVVREDINQPPPAPLPDPGPILATPRNNGGSVFYNDIGAVPPNQIAGSATANLAIMTGGPARPYPSPLTLRNAGDLVSMQGMRGGGIMGIGGDAPMNNGLLQGVVGLGRGGGGGGGVTIAAAPPMVSAVNTIFSDGLVKSGGDLSPISPMPYVFGGGMRGRKRSGAVEKVVERRQRRMIKNRESAARSRARKQAYTMELEAEIAKLKVQNEELQNKQEEILEMQKNQVLEIISQQQQRPKKQCLKRTQTGPW